MQQAKTSSPAVARNEPIVLRCLE